MKNISIVIPCRNEKDFIERCIQSAVDSEYPEELIEIIVCDGLSDDGTVEILRELQRKIPLIKLINNEKKSTSAARNLGVQHSSGDYILILDAHSEIAPNYISENASILDQRPEIWCSGGILKNVHTSPISKNIACAMSSPFGVGGAYFRTGQREGYVDTTATPMYRKEVFEKIGLFDEELVRNQDDDFNFRLIDAGGKIWLTSKTFMRYFVRSTFAKLFSQYFLYGYWKVYVNKKNRAVTTFRQLIPFFFVLFLSVGLIASMIQPWNFRFYLFIIILYIAISLGSAVKFSRNLQDILEIMFSFFILHFSYGLGYTKGILDFLVFRKRAQKLKN